MKISFLFYLFLTIFFIFVLVHPEEGAITISDPPDGVLIYLYPSGSVLSLVSQHTFLPLKNQWYVEPFPLI